MKKIVSAFLMMGLVVVAVMGFGSPAVAAGSDSPTPYTVDTAGVTLPAGETFKANGHVNIKYLNKGQVKSAGIHFDPNNNQPGGKWIGRSFIPWSAFSADIECITWVQVHGYNQHYGEGGQAKVCIKKPSTPPPSDKEVRERVTEVNCEERIVKYVKEERTAVYDYDYDKGKWVQTGWNEWKVVDSGFRNELDKSCEDLPEVGSPINGGVLLGGALVALLAIGSGTYLLRRS